MPKLKAHGETIRALWQSVLYEKQENCLLCGKAHGPICPTCEEEFFHPELGRCRDCGKLVSKEQLLCRDCGEGRGPKGLNRVAAWGHYTGAWRDYIQSVKFKSQPYLLREIARPFADWAIRNLPPPDALVPVPMHLERIAERGFNQSSVLASALHWELGIPLIEGLERTTPTTPQVGLNRYDRLHNLSGVFSLSAIGEKWGFKGRRIWLLDDVVTTGATLESCANVLREWGAEEVYGLTLAAGIQVNI
ncbi:ComF family protein [Desulfitobacterium sp.]|uniref:ComF family protein n=1 Tax=Desulfitobacterium sp. TaxID=49981 RepID=UPI002BB7072A|nr:ComF family protein [Desulfitobacterium sp.]HVJ47986.1 ComF family protein [Desulfitobacterium sp.]